MAFIDLIAVLTKLFVQMFQLFNERARHLEQELALVRELDFGATPVEKRCGQFAFQALNLLGDRRLAQAMRRAAWEMLPDAAA